MVTICQVLAGGKSSELVIICKATTFRINSTLILGFFRPYIHNIHMVKIDIMKPFFLPIIEQLHDVIDERKFSISRLPQSSSVK